MNDHIKDAALRKAMVILKSLDCRYHIVDTDGVEYGEPIHKVEKRKNKYEYGKLNAYMEKCLGGINVGETKDVFLGEFDIDSIQTSACNYMRKVHGPGSSLTARSKDKTYVTVLCLSTRKNTEESEVSS